MRRRLFPISAALSALALVYVGVMWVDCFGASCGVLDSRVVEATQYNLVLDSYTVQHAREGLWVGRCRVRFASALGAVLGVGDMRPRRDEFHNLTRRIGVFTIDRLSPPLTGIGHQSRVATYSLGLGNLMQFELDGYLIPNGVLAAAAGLLPAVWVVLRLRRWVRGRTAAIGG